MILPVVLADVNVLVYAHRADAPEHDAYRGWLDEVVNGNAAFGVADLVLSGFLRVVTHPKVFVEPSPLDAALEFVSQVRTSPNCVVLAPGERHWEIFIGLVHAAGARGNLIPDAYLAALAIEHGADWATTDQDYTRFPGLRWHHPLRGGARS
jgi:uncharacterized protein